MLDIYQFIKYNSETSIENLKKKGESGAVICFDLEDSIYNWIDESGNDNFKKEYRIFLKQILKKLDAESISIKTGVRINSFESGYQLSDIESFPANIKIHSILIPKVEKRSDIDNVVNRLESRNIIFNEIIPIIETREGLCNLEDILNSKYQVIKVGFGHCDYNLSIGAFPFFHQDTLEYWKWVSRMIAILKPRNIKFINSAYLSLYDSAFFSLMLSHLQFLYKDNFGQFTLCLKQSLLCNSFSGTISSNQEIARNRLDFKVNTTSLTNLISSFENENTGQGFTVTLDKGIFISPQEYCSAKQNLLNRKEQDVNITFVGGCFPVQGDILFEDLFHQKLKNAIEPNLLINCNVNIIRYEKFSNVLEKITNNSKERVIEYLIFHIRPEPYLRLIKLYYKYLNYDYKLCRSLNLPFLNILNPEKYDLLLMSGRYSYNAENRMPKLYKAMVNLNYLLGYVIGNQFYATKKYLKLVEEVIDYCTSQEIKLVLLGPAIRSNVWIESCFSRRLEKFMSKSLKNRNINYVYGLEEHHESGKKYFNANGIHATELYHELIAKRLYDEIKADIQK